MRRFPHALATLAVATALCLGACSAGGDSPGGPDGAPSRTSAVDTACSVVVPPVGSTSAAPAVPGKARGKVGVILPADSPGPVPRQREGALLTRSLARVGLTTDVWSAPGNQRGYVAIARNLIADGVQVLILGASARGSGARVERVADRAGVEVIEYGGLVLGGTASSYVSFDYEQIGRLEARTLVSCLTSRGVTDPRIILVNGGTDVDENAVLLDIGAHQVLDPLVTAGDAALVQETTVTGWRSADAPRIFTQALDLADGRVDGVLTASDDLASAVIGVLQQRGLDDTVVVGQGPGTVGLRNVAQGQQSATVHTDLAREADAAAQLALALVSGDPHALDALQLSDFADPLSPDRVLKALWVPGQVVTQAVAQALGGGVTG